MIALKEHRLNRRLLLLSLPLVLVAGVLFGIGTLPTAHAASPGTVCLNDGSAAAAPPASPCPATPYVFDSPYPSTPQAQPTQIRVGVYIYNSPPLQGFDVTLLANRTVLKPVGFDLTGTVLTGAPVVINECLDGILVAGTTCFSTDTTGTLHLAATSQYGFPLTPNATSGLLFTALYSVIGTSPAAGISVGFQTGCTNTSVTGGVCVTVENGSATLVPETIQSGTLFNNSGNTIPWVAVTSNVTSVTVPVGASTGNAVDITAAAENGWPGFSMDSISYTASATSGFPAPSLSATSCSPGTPGPNCHVNLIVNTAIGGSYSVNLIGTYVAFDTNGLTATLVAPVTIQVNVQDVAWTINGVTSTSGQTDYVPVGTTVPLSFSAQSIGGYSGSITYSTGTLSDGGTGIAFSYPSTFALSPGATIVLPVNAAASSEGAATYRASLNATSLPLKTSGALLIRVSGFSLVTNVTSVSFISGKSGGISTTVTSLGNPASTNGFAGPVTISSSVTGPGALTVKCTTPLTLTAGGTSSGTCTFSGTTAGTYTVTIKGTGGTAKSITNSTVVTVNIPAVNGFKVSASASSITILSSGTATSTITVSSQGAFSQAVTLGSLAYPSGLICSLFPSSLTPPAGGLATSMLSCTGQGGIYTVTLTASSTGFSSQTITLQINVQDFSISGTNPSPFDITQTGTSSATINSLAGFSGTVALTINPSVGLTASLGSSTISGGSGSTTLTLNAPTAGIYSVMITGTSGPLSHTATVSVQVVDFQIFASPTTVTTTAGAAGTSVITVAPVNDFTETVSLSEAISPSTGLTCSLTPSSIANGTGSSMLSCTGTGGTYTVTVTATTGSLSHSSTVTVDVTDFTLTASPPTMTLVQGTSSTSAITVIAVGGFTGSVTLSATAPGLSGITVALSSTSISMSGSSILTVTALGAAIPGTYTVTITGTSGPITHNAAVIVVVERATTSALPPVITQATWVHHFSLARNNGFQTWKLGFQNPSNVTEYASFHIIGVDNTGLNTFTVDTAVFQLGPEQNINHIQPSLAFTTSQLGLTFSFTVTVQWGVTPTTDPALLPFTSPSTASGSFTVLP